MPAKRQVQKNKPKAVKTKVAKTEAPEKERAEQKERFDVEFYRAWCKECGICAAFCPVGALEMNDKGEPEIARPELCTGCTWCELRCPDFAISVRKKREEVAEA